MTGTEIQNELDELIQIGNLFEGRQWFLGTSGNFSALMSRNPLSFAITSSGIDKGNAKRDSFVTINSEGQIISTHSKKNTTEPSGEWAVHRAIYQNTDARCVIHVHTIPALLICDLFGDQGGVQIGGLEILKGLGCKSANDNLYVPIIHNKDQTVGLAASIEHCIKTANQPKTLAVLVRYHGMFVWGDSVSTAKCHIELLMHAFEYFVARRLMNI